VTASPNVFIRKVQRQDEQEFVKLMRESISMHEPWISPPHSPALFKYYMQRVAREDHEGFVVCRRQDDAIVGVININNIVRGSFQSASLGYYVGAKYHGHGYMVEGLKLLVNLAFNTLGLHRLEANIQPDNRRSIQLVRRCGFEKEGLSPRFLYINGAWRDHERWCIVDERRGLRP
jgi:ribosomal-protein-alanine N-acetyltransferase